MSDRLQADPVLGALRRARGAIDVSVIRPTKRAEAHWNEIANVLDVAIEIQVLRLKQEFAHSHDKKCPVTGRHPVMRIHTDHALPGLFNACEHCQPESSMPVSRRLAQLEERRRKEHENDEG